VILEDLRQLCLYYKFSPQAWWTYIQNYDTFCLTDGKMEACSQHALLTVGVEWKDLQRCVNQAFDSMSSEHCTRNSLLDDQFRQEFQDGIIIFPSAVVNNVTIRV
jgi:hypothetical protein